MSFVRQKIFGIWSVPALVPAVPANKYSHQHSLSLPLLVLFILCQLLLDFPLHREPTSSIALLLTANQASAFNFALKAPRRRLPVISQCPNLVGTFQFSSILQRTLFDQLKLNQTHCRALDLLSPCYIHCNMYVVLSPRKEHHQ